MTAFLMKAVAEVGAAAGLIFLAAFLQKVCCKACVERVESNYFASLAHQSSKFHRNLKGSVDENSDVVL